MAARVVVLFLTILLTGCNAGPKEKRKIHNDSPSIGEVTLNFDGTFLTGWEVTNFGPQGPVSVSDDQIILGMGEGCTGITWKGDFPKVDYEVSLDAKRVEGNDFFCGLTFPAGKDPCTLIIGGWGEQPSD